MQLSQYKVLKQRTNKSLANDKFRPTPNKYTSDYPLQIVQIDHTKVDLQILDVKRSAKLGSIKIKKSYI
jgi:putative transposase